MTQHTVRLTINPGKTLTVGEQEFTDLTRYGLIVADPAPAAPADEPTTPRKSTPKSKAPAAGTPEKE